jgi:hypothetical protein
MTLTELDTLLLERGVKLSLRIAVKGPRSALRPEVVNALEAHKPALMARLAAVDVLARAEPEGGSSLVPAATREVPGDSPATEPEADAQEGEPARPAPPDPVTWRRVLPGWSIEWRQRWGDRANELAEAGVHWPHDEAQAFAEISAERNANRGPIPD